MDAKPTPLIVYGPLCAMPLLAWVLKGATKNIAEIKHMFRPARIYGFSRRALHNRMSPGAIWSSDRNEIVVGYVVAVDDMAQRHKLNAKTLPS